MKDYKIKLIGKKEIGENTVALIFDIKNIDYKFQPGQYAHFTIIDPALSDPKGNSRPLSIASSPDNKESLIIAARKGSSSFINNLTALPVGRKVYISKPSGNLFIDTDTDAENVFIVGGIGITPVRSIIEYIFANKIKNKIHLFYSNRTESQTAFLKDLKKWEKSNKNFKFIPTIDDRENNNWKYEFGKIDGKMLKKHLKKLDKKNYYLIGPPVMVDSMKKMLMKEKVSIDKIRTEKFK